jgi:hypothetical protein
MQMFFRLVSLILVILLQKAKLTVNETLTGPYNLVVGLQFKENGTFYASGSLYRDSHINITFTASETGLVINGFCSDCTLQNVSVYGLNASMTNCIIVSPVNGATCTETEENGVIEINNLELDLSKCENYAIEWELQTNSLQLNNLTSKLLNVKEEPNLKQ